MESIICPECGEPLSEEGLAKSLICPHCGTNLKDKKYMDFLEFLMVSEIVEDIDFFDESVYGEEYIKYEATDFDDTEEPAFQPNPPEWDNESEEHEEDWGEDSGNKWDD